MSVALLLGLACGGGAPTTMAGCAALSDVQAREECRFGLARGLLDQPEALQAALAQVAEVESRDLLLLRLAVAEPTRASSLCGLVTTEGASEKCRQVVGRPHLSTTPRGPR